MKTITMKKFATMSLSAMMVFSTTAGIVNALEVSNSNIVTETENTINGVARQQTTTYEEGVTVVADENSKSGYTAHFVYDLQADLANKDGSERSQILEVIPAVLPIISLAPNSIIAMIKVNKTILNHLPFNLDLAILFISFLFILSPSFLMLS